MIAEIGTISLILAWVMCLLQSFSVFFVYVKKNAVWWSYLTQTAKPIALMQFILVLVSFLCLVHAFVNHDYSLAYVAQNSNSHLPIWFRISAVWGGHEGSLLLWVLVLSTWSLLVAKLSTPLPKNILTLVLAVMQLISTGFLAFLLFTSNPFAHLSPHFPIDGNDLNPLLQDIGLIIHPPVLYIGYVGFSVAFAFAIAGLIEGRLDTAWAKWTRPWTIAAWAFLGCGIALGSWWAYYELGWGGWWFWDPVENASFMPWLAGTALIHSLAVCEKRSTFRVWTLFLALLTFSLSLLGAFLVRSGVLTSVHAFASDPTRGLFLLVLLLITVGGSLLLFACRAHLIQSSSQYSWLSRESMLFANNLILTFALIVVLLGTLYPLLSEALNMGLISVGPPFFNAFFVPTTLLLLALLVIGLSARWKSNALNEMIRVWLMRLGCGFILALIWLQLSNYQISLPSVLALGFTLSVAVAILHDLMDKTKNATSRLKGLARLKPSYWAMQIGHIGLVVAVIGVTWTGLFSTEKDLLLGVGEKWEAEGYQFYFKETQAIKGPNYTATRGHFEVYSPSGDLFKLFPEKRNYPVRGDVMTEAAIHPGLTRDLYVSLGEMIGQDQWSVRIYLKPYIRWIWFGSLVMALAALVSICDKRYRVTGRSLGTSTK